MTNPPEKKKKKKSIFRETTGRSARREVRGHGHPAHGILESCKPIHNEPIVLIYGGGGGVASRRPSTVQSKGQSGWMSGGG